MKESIIRPAFKGVSGNGANDCTVRAVCNAIGLPYVEAHEVLKRFGRPSARGAVFHTLVKAYTSLGFELVGSFGTSQSSQFDHYTAERVLGRDVKQYRGITVKSFIESTPAGTFICTSNNHAFAVVDGKLIDSVGLRGGIRITSIFKYN